MLTWEFTIKNGIPAPRQILTTSGISARGGSTIPTIPTTTRSLVWSRRISSTTSGEPISLTSTSEPGITRRASNNTRWPAEDHLDWIVTRDSSSSGVNGATTPEGRTTEEQRGRRTSGAPLMNMTTSISAIDGQVYGHLGRTLIIHLSKALPLSSTKLALRKFVA